MARREPRRTSHCFEAPCTAASRDGGKARARYGAGAVAHRSEKRLPSRPTHLYQLPKANSAVGEGLPQAPRPPRKTRRTLPELASRSLNTAHRQHEQPTEAPTQELEGLEGAARGALFESFIGRPQRVARGVSSKIVGPGRADAALGPAELWRRRGVIARGVVATERWFSHTFLRTTLDGLITKTKYGQTGEAKINTYFSTRTTGRRR